MRKTLFAFGIVIALLIASAWLEREAQSPPVRPALEQVCAETMQRTPADHSWVAPNREEMVRSHQIQSVTLGELPAYDGRLVRVAGVLHAEFEWVALYPSRAAMEEPLPRPPWVALASLWPEEPYWHTKGPAISDRCVVVEGTYASGIAGHMGMFNGQIRDALRLEVWSRPHRPFVTLPPPPPRIDVDSPCADFPVQPQKLPDASANKTMSAEFDKLYATGEFQLGYCLAEVRVNEMGTVDGVRVVRPQNVDRRVESIIVDAMKSSRYKPATACKRAVPSTVSVGIGHCPSKVNP